MRNETIRRFVDRLPLRGKIILIFAITSIFGFSLVAAYFVEKSEKLFVLDSEIAGVNALGVVADVSFSLLGFSNAGPGDVSRAAVAAQALDRLRQIAPLLGEAVFAQCVQLLSSQDADEIREAVSGGKFAALFSDILFNVANRSQLVLDRNLDSYYMMTLSVDLLPKFVVLLRKHGRTLIVRNLADNANTDFIAASNTVLREIERNLAVVATASVGNAAAQRSADIMFDLRHAQTHLTVAERFPEIEDRTQAAQRAVYQAATAWLWSIAELKSLLEAKRAQVAFEIAASAVGLIAATLLAYLSIAAIVRRITAPVRELERVARRVTSDRLERVAWQGGDEFGRFATAFNEMVQRLIDEGAARTQLAAQARSAHAQADILDAIGLPVMALRAADGVCLHANKAARTIFPDIDAMHAEPFWFAAPPDRKALTDLLASGPGVEQFETDVARPDAPSEKMQISVSRIDYESIPCLLVSLVPINRLVNALDAAATTSQILSEAVDALGAVYTVWTPDGRFVSRGSGARARMMFPGGWAMPEDATTFANFLASIRSSGSVESREFSTVRGGKIYSEGTSLEENLGIWQRAFPDGRFLETRVARLTNGGFVVISIDQTALDKARRNAERSETILRGALDTMGSNFSAYTADEVLFFWQGQDLDIDLPSAAGADGKRPVLFREVLERLTQAGLAEIRETSTVRGGGTYLDYTPLAERLGSWDRFMEDGRYLRTTVTRLEDGNYSVITHDFTQLHATKQALGRVEKMAALGSLVAGIAHEVNTPIGVALTASTLLTDDLAEAQAQFAGKTLTAEGFVRLMRRSAEIATMISRNLSRAAELVASFKKVSVDQTSDIRRSFDLKSYVEEIVQSLAPAYRHTPLVFRVDGDGGVLLESFPGAIGQIVTNLATNALAHAYPPSVETGEVRFTVRDDGDFAQLQYADDGVGMDQATLRQIFEPFFTTKRAKGGTGLGMTVVFNLITQRLGGTIQVSSTVAAGVRMHIRFPKIVPVRSGDDAKVPGLAT
jgi:signal transduction histidine kinase/HAMP domain-containing protein